jgi:hypothetical protein
MAGLALISTRSIYQALQSVSVANNNDDAGTLSQMGRGDVYAVRSEGRGPPLMQFSY